MYLSTRPIILTKFKSVSSEYELIQKSARPSDECYFPHKIPPLNIINTVKPHNNGIMFALANLSL